MALSTEDLVPVDWKDVDPWGPWCIGAAYPSPVPTAALPACRPTHSFVSAGHRHEMASPGDWRRVKTPTS